MSGYDDILPKQMSCFAVLPQANNSARRGAGRCDHLGPLRSLQRPFPLRAICAAQSGAAVRRDRVLPVQGDQHQVPVCIY
jgi:hypothetical protein